MGWHRNRVVLMEWFNCGPSAIDFFNPPGPGTSEQVERRVREAMTAAYEETRVLWEERIGRPTSYPLEAFLALYSGAFGGTNGRCTAAIFHSGTKGGWHLDEALERTAQKLMADPHLHVVDVVLSHDFREVPTAYIHQDSNRDTDAAMPPGRDPGTYLPCEDCEGRGEEFVLETCGGCLGDGNGLDRKEARSAPEED